MRRACLIVLLLLSPQGLLADVSPHKCQTYFTENTTAAPDEVLGVFRKTRADAVEFCPDQSHRMKGSVFFVSEITKGPFGVCQFYKDRLFPRVEQTGALSWSTRPPQGQEGLGGRRMYMMGANRGCGRQDDIGYVAVTDVSEGVFLILLGFWERFSTSDDFSEFENQLLPGFRIPDELKAVIENGAAGRGEIKVSSIHLKSSLDSGLPVNLTTHYDLAIHATTGGWYLKVDLTERGPRLLALGEIDF